MAGTSESVWPEGTGSPEQALNNRYFFSRSLNTFWTLSTFGATTARQ
jgi:hypothetical protein